MRGKLFLLSFLSAALLTAAWPAWGFSPLLFIAFIPLLYVQHIISSDNRLRARHLFFYAYLAFVTWNALTTWWVWFASAGGACMAILCNALIMAFVFLIFHKVKRALPERLGAFALIPIWISFEFLHLDWDLSWPWLTLGNGLAKDYTWIQWYEYTGVFGGSFWILLINVMIFQLIVHRNTLFRHTVVRITTITAVILLVVLPVIFSLFRYYHFDLKANTTEPINVVVVQPNVDPYIKFDLDFRETAEKMLDLAAAKVDSTTDYVVMPETALTEDLWEQQINTTWSVHRLKKFRSTYPRMTIITGATTGREYGPNDQRSATARKYKRGDGWFDIYNSAVQVDASDSVELYHKSKLVPGVEKMPFPKYLGFLEKLAIDLGGSTGSLGVQDERTVFKTHNGNGKIAPVICYESIYGDYVSQYIRNGADYIFIITNDGWWGNTPGYKQHLEYGRLRAIETRKSIARSANTGISCFFNQRGDMEQPQKWWTPAAIKQTLYSTKGETFYTRHGDYIARAMLWIAIAACGFTFFKWIRKKFAK